MGSTPTASERIACRIVRHAQTGGHLDHPPPILDPAVLWDAGRLEAMEGRVLAG
jgi:hypothetical protein